MENASKALLMAGGVLIALLIIGSLVLLFSNLQDYQNTTNISEKQAQIAKFNNQFEPYNKKGLTLMELTSVYNKIESNNAKYPEYEIKTNIDEVYPDIITKHFSEIEESEKATAKFNCIKIEYKNEGGRISSINFESK